VRERFLEQETPKQESKGLQKEGKDTILPRFNVGPPFGLFIIINVYIRPDLSGDIIL
jgi:hypothetical protein